jgi:predicted transcriptional regulator YheO
MKLMSLKQYKKMSKTALMRKITKTLRTMPKAKLALLCYNLTKAKLPRLKVIKRKAINGRKGHKAKRKFSKKQLAAQRLFAKRAKAGTLRKRRRR